MVANKQILKYMPKGTDINAITYGQVYAWAKAIRKGTGQSRFGYPRASTGLIHRFLQGFLVPSFTGGFVTNFRSKDAARGMGVPAPAPAVTHPQSLTYGFMQVPLLSEEVLLAWDHVARLKTALDQRPDYLIAFPVPKVPKARPYMPVIVGMAIPKNAPNAAGARRSCSTCCESAPRRRCCHRGILPGRPWQPVQEHLTRAARGSGRSAQAAEGEGRRSGVAPGRIGAEGGNFNKIYIDTFTRIVRNGENIQTVLNEQGALLQQIFDRPEPPAGRLTRPAERLPAR